MAETFNREGCTCGKDHDTVEHIVGGLLRAVQQNEIHITELTLLIELSMDKVGWTNPDAGKRIGATATKTLELMFENEQATFGDLEQKLIEDILADGWVHPVVTKKED